MSVTYGFYNSLNHDRKYSALQMSQIFDGIINDGVYATIGGCLMVSPGTQNSGMSVNVSTGRAWFNHTWTYNDSIIPLTIQAADLIVSRIDAVVLTVDTRRSERKNYISVVKGTAQTNPQKPTLIKADGVYQYPLAYVKISPSATRITASMIENAVGTSACPFVTGPLKVLNTDQIIAQWQIEWGQYLAEKTTEFNTWVAQFEEDHGGEFNEWETEQKTQFERWEQARKDEYDEWFSELSYILDGDVAGKLQNEIDQIINIGSGSIIIVNTNESSLIGKECHLTGPGVDMTATFSAEGKARFTYVGRIGTFTVSASNGASEVTDTFDLPYFGYYETALNFWSATIKISTSSEELFEKPIQITSDVADPATVYFSSAGRATYTVYTPGNYTFTVEYEE